MDLIPIEIDNYKPHPQNPNGHPDAQLDALGDSLGLFGQYENVVVWNDYYLAGHGLVDAARRKGLKTLDAVDLSHLSDEQALSLMVADNRLPELAVMGDEALAEILQSMTAPEDIPGVDQAFIDELLAGITPPGAGDDAEPQIDRAAELAEEYGVEVGQLRQLGEHRLICGDCTDEAVVERVMGGERAGLLFEDPPYGIKRDEGFGGFGGFGKPIARKKYTGGWDEQRPLKNDFDLHLSICKNALIFGGNFFADLLPQSTHWIVWDKLNTMPTFGDCELIWTDLDRKSVKKMTFQYNGLIGKEKERYHATQKPVGLYGLILGEYSQDNEIIADFYSGSGTTIIACENLGRRCRAIELDPGYVAVAIRRWEELTGGKAEMRS